MVKVRAIRPLSGSYGMLQPGQVYDVEERLAIELEARGLVEMVRAAPEIDEAAVQERLEQNRKRLKEAPENKDLGSAPENKEYPKGRKKK